ncbi:glutamine amidotransferase, class-II [Afipia carboxidovorans OM5]|uniref:Putative regulatory protein n=1 Tax=Afipia carboxidovorans (strain ATCC 49405 / DSM 1227 / KCTC 32145 / OM5) TaxID=504832 RepID=B6JIE9_AFIC5|nr:FmdB family zinc ribbon protein [Afipia carboxidovorans]ACI94193.1 glutamine amidotransferase, class-II [Afipia carboxidovorans OM5]AEI02156.1 putative regulatory protein [Afipia carboxidovorans OM4]AEI05732.1 putative regulatory protein [Afipia carboxidovorans OM5]
MPLYSYACEECGPFEGWAEMSEAEKAMCCPSCAAEAARMMATPHLSTMGSGLRRALSRSEKTASEPRVVSRKHLAGCGCALCAVRKKPTPIERRWSLGH